MSKLVFTASLLAVLAIAACSPAAAAPPVAPPVPSSPSGSLEPPDPAIVDFTEDEMDLVEGIRPGAALDCEPVRAELPRNAVAGVECIGGEWFVARVGFYRFDTDEKMLEHYTTRMQAEGVTLDRGSCFDGEGDGQYIPGDEEVTSRHGCFITAEGVANYRLLLPGAHVSVGIVGHNIDTVELEDFAFLGGTHDTPSFPTIWSNAGT